MVVSRDIPGMNKTVDIQQEGKATGAVKLSIIFRYLVRSEEDPDVRNPLGTLEAPENWEGLSLATKVRTIHDLCEWQLTNPDRFRTLVRNEEESEDWRVYPIGWDAKENAYWLFDDNRLWIQYPPPPPPPKKKAPAKKGSKRARAEAAAAAKEKKQAQANGSAKKGTGKRTASTTVAPPAKRSRTSVGSTPQITPRKGVRSSRRLRGDDEGGADSSEWEAVPSDLVVYGNGVKAEDDDDNDSELSEPPPVEDETLGDVTMKSEAADESMALDDDGTRDEAQGTAETKVDPDEETWLEYEVIAITKAEWEEIGTRFAKSKDADEKALHKLLKEDIVPRVLQDIEAAEKAAALEAALAARKRSSRIAMKESEREEREREAEARAKMEERMKRIRDEEKEKKRREDEARAEERKREDRLREREERLRARELEAES